MIVCCVFRSERRGDASEVRVAGRALLAIEPVAAAHAASGARGADADSGRGRRGGAAYVRAVGASLPGRASAKGLARALRVPPLRARGSRKGLNDTVLHSIYS